MPQMEDVHNLINIGPTKPGVVVKFYSSVEITLYLLADFLLQYVTLFQSRDIVKNLISL